MRRLIATTVALCLVSIGPALAQDADPTFTSDRYGFRFTHPASWTCGEITRVGNAEYVVAAKEPGETGTSFTVFVVPRPAPITSSEAARASTEATWRNSGQISGISSGNARVAGRAVRWMRGTYRTNDGPFILRQHFVIRGDQIFVLQSAAREAAFRDSTFASQLASFELTSGGANPADPDAPDSPETLADRCGSEIGLEATWREASARAKREQKTVLVIFEVYRGLDLPDRISLSRVFMNRDVVALIQERFVPIFWTDDTDAPFDSPAVYGLGPNTFGRSMLFATPEGRVIGQVTSFNWVAFIEAAREVLVAHPGAPPRDATDCRELLRRGDYELAGERLADPTTPAQWIQVAELRRRLQKGPEALAALAVARDRGASLADTQEAEAMIHLHLGEFDKCVEALSGATSAMARYWRAFAKSARASFGELSDATKAEMRQLTRDQPDSPYAWRAAALLLGRHPGVGQDRPQWPSRNQLGACRVRLYDPTGAPLAAAVRLLVQSQHYNGTWLSPMSMARDPDDTPGAITIATTSICGSALLPFANQTPGDFDRLQVGNVPDAVNKALQAVLQADVTGKGMGGFDYTIWAQIFTLRFLARCVNARVGERAALVKRMNAIVDGLDQGEMPGGGWAYVKLEGHDDNPIGFVTAAAMLALIEARAAGATVPAHLIKRGGDVLVSLRAREGWYGYMRATGPTPPARAAEASLRSPLYVLALLREGADRANVAGLRVALNIYLRFRTHTLAERGKAMCHTGAEGTASYYLLYGYAFAAESLAELPADQRPRYRAALRADVLAHQQSDGGFCDNPAIGRAYGTAMALLALESLRP